MFTDPHFLPWRAECYEDHLRTHGDNLFLHSSFFGRGWLTNIAIPGNGHTPFMTRIYLVSKGLSDAGGRLTGR